MSLPRVHIAKYYSESYGHRAIAWCGWIVRTGGILTIDLSHPALCKRCLRAYNKAVDATTR